MDMPTWSRWLPVSCRKENRTESKKYIKFHQKREKTEEAGSVQHFLVYNTGIYKRIEKHYEQQD